MPKRILLIDDEKEILAIVKKKLEQAGYETYVAYNGREGLEVTQQVHPHLILTDIAMPILDGVGFYNELKNRQDLQHIPVMVSTAHGSTEDQMRSLGVKDFLLKPFSPQSLVDTIGHFFTQRKAANVLIATKMLFLMKAILQDSKETVQLLDIHLTNNSQTIIEEAVALKPDLIILDVDMFIKPSAKEMVEALRQQPSLKETHILLNRNTLGDVSAQAKEEDVAIKECLDKGASHFVGSLNKETFLSIIEEYCHKKPSR